MDPRRTADATRGRWHRCDETSSSDARRLLCAKARPWRSTRDGVAIYEKTIGKILALQTAVGNNQAN